MVVSSVSDRSIDAVEPGDLRHDPDDRSVRSRAVERRRFDPAFPDATEHLKRGGVESR